MSKLDRARGALWGQAIGDAVGTTAEFSRPRDVKPFPQLNLAPQSDLVGGGPFGLPPGHVTDDTQMAVCLASSLAACSGFDADDAARRYVEWSEAAFDIGRQTRAVLAILAKGAPAREAGHRIWEATRREAAPNGSLMRTSPIPVFFAEDALRLRQAALDDSAITHADPRCRLACAAFGAAIRNAIVSDATPESMRRAALEELTPAAGGIDSRTPAELVDGAVAALSTDLDLATREDPQLESPDVHLHRHAGFVRVAFRLAFWELLHAPTFEACVLDCANRGGDADTNGAIAGALYGGLVGESKIRADWREKVERAGRAGTPWADLYHPRRLFAIALRP